MTLLPDPKNGHPHRRTVSGRPNDWTSFRTRGATPTEGVRVEP